MFNYLLIFLNYLDNMFWGYIGFGLVLILGLILSTKFRFFQLHKINLIIKEFFKVSKLSKCAKGIHPIKIFFSSVGGMVGIGNVVGIITAVQIGGPGALFWVWIAAPLGAIIKYSEIFLGLKYRVYNKETGYEGGPMYFLKKAFKWPIIPFIISGLLCIYGVEIYQFNVMCDSLADNLHLSKLLVAFSLLGLVLYACMGGITRISKICSILMPFFMVVYTSMCLYIIIKNINFLPDMFSLVFKSAFKGHAAIGGFAGSSMIIAIKQGISRAVYSGDIGIGYDSVINSQSACKSPQSQSVLSIMGIFVDNFICTLSILVVLTSFAWQMGNNIEGSVLIQMTFSKYFPYMNIFMPIFIFLTGYSTIISYFSVGLKCANYINNKLGTKLYYLYATFALLFFSFFSQTIPLLIISLAGGGLILINLVGIYILRNKIAPPFIKEKDNKKVLTNEIDPDSDFAA